jgi:serine/threonine protein kinase
MIDTILNNRYQICEQLSIKPGRKVFKAQDLQSGNLVIVKILLFNDPDSRWEEYKKFEQETRVLKNLDHPAIPKYLDYFDVETGRYNGFALVQTYIDAPSLELLIQQGRTFSENELIEIANKLLGILDYIHQQNPTVIHRDIKPSNILLTNRSGHSVGELYLVDFGYAQTTASREDGSFSIAGTSGYIAPDQFMRRTVPASDLYSLGMTIIYLATGIHPVDLPEVNGQPKFNNLQLSKRLQNWLEKMIKINLKQRFSSAKLAQKSLNFNNDSSFVNYPELQPQKTELELIYDGNSVEINLPSRVEMINKIDRVNLLNQDRRFALFYLFKLLGASFLIKNFSKNNLPHQEKKLTYFFYLFYLLVACPFKSLFQALPTSVCLTIITSLLAWPFPLSFSVIYLVLFVIFFKNNWTEKPKLNLKVVTQITINKDEINAFNINQGALLTDLRSEIYAIAYYPRHKFDEIVNRQGKIMHEWELVNEPKLIIKAKSASFVIDNLSRENEYEWLGKELSTFLNLELQIIYSNPVVEKILNDDD